MGVLEEEKGLSFMVHVYSNHSSFRKTIFPTYPLNYPPDYSIFFLNFQLGPAYKEYW